MNLTIHRRDLALFGWLCVLLLSASPSHAIPTAAEGQQPRVIGVFGDSLADGAWSGLYSVVKAHPGDKLFRYSKVGAGLTKPDFAGWMTETEAALDKQKIDTAVVMIGTNDQESIRDDARKGYLFQSDGWRRVYLQRIDEVIGALAKHHVTLVWVGLPIMRKDDLNAGAAYLDSIFIDAVRQAGGTFLPMIDEFRGPDGNFAAYLPDPTGRLRQIRAEDGIHFTGSGYELLAEKIYAAFATAKPLAEIQATSPDAPTSSLPVTVDPPAAPTDRATATDPKPQ